MRAARPEAVYADVLSALAELLDDGGGGGAPSPREAAAEARDPGRPARADRLGEVLYVAERDGSIPEWVARVDLDRGRVEAVVEGRDGEPRPIGAAWARPATCSSGRRALRRSFGTVCHGAG